MDWYFIQNADRSKLQSWQYLSNNGTEKNYMQIIKFKENALEISAPVLGHLFYPQNRAYIYVYLFLENWKYITVFKSKHTIIFNFSEFKKKANTGEFQKKGGGHEFLHFLIMTHIPGFFYRIRILVKVEVRNMRKRKPVIQYGPLLLFQ
jgi:hypothetical protein